MNAILSIALGGALGAVARHGLNSGVTALFGFKFPLGIMAVNILGSFILGVLVTAFALYWDVHHLFRTMIVVGFLGAFTTFSTFSLDSVAMLERGDIGAGLFYIAGSVIFSITALYFGMALARSFAS